MCPQCDRFVLCPREILVLEFEDLQDLQGHQDPPSDRTSW